jgi:hypothetical protein
MAVRQTTSVTQQNTFKNSHFRLSRIRKMEFIIGPFVVLSRADDGPSTGEEFHCRIVLVLECKVRAAAAIGSVAGAHSSDRQCCRCTQQ